MPRISNSFALIRHTAPPLPSSTRNRFSPSALSNLRPPKSRKASFNLASVLSFPPRFFSSSFFASDAPAPPLCLSIFWSLSFPSVFLLFPFRPPKNPLPNLKEPLFIPRLLLPRSPGDPLRGLICFFQFPLSDSPSDASSIFWISLAGSNPKILFRYFPSIVRSPSDAFLLFLGLSLPVWSLTPSIPEPSPHNPRDASLLSPELYACCYLPSVAFFCPCVWAQGYGESCVSERLLKGSQGQRKGLERMDLG